MSAERHDMTLYAAQYVCELDGYQIAAQNAHMEGPLAADRCS